MYWQKTYPEELESSFWLLEEDSSEETWRRSAVSGWSSSFFESSFRGLPERSIHLFLELPDAFELSMVWGKRRQ